MWSMPTGLKRVTLPTETIATLADLKAHCRVDWDEEDAILQTYLDSAIDYIQTQTGQQFGTSTFDYSLPALCSPITLPIFPVQSVTSVKYYDQDDVQQTLSSDDYYVDNFTDPVNISVKYHRYWPISINRANAVIVRFVAGYEPISLAAPSLKMACLLLAADWNEHREDSVEVRLQSIPTGIKNLIRSNSSGVYR